LLNHLHTRRKHKTERLAPVAVGRPLRLSADGLIDCCLDAAFWAAFFVAFVFSWEY
jgi:hypothetical protein